MLLCFLGQGPFFTSTPPHSPAAAEVWRGGPLSSSATCEVEVWMGCSLWPHSNTYPKLQGSWVGSKFKLLKNNKGFLKVSTPLTVPLHFSLPTHTRAPFLFKAWG